MRKTRRHPAESPTVPEPRRAPPADPRAADPQAVAHQADGSKVTDPKITDPKIAGSKAASPRALGPKIVGPSDKINIPTDLLRTFVAIYQLGSFTKAAHLFELTQPAVSAHMKKLESLIGSDLIERNVAGVNLTACGEEVLKYARRILLINDQIVSSASVQRALPVIRLGIPNIFAAFKLKRILTEGPGTVGNSRLQICCDHSLSLLRSIHSGYLDLAFVMSDEEEEATRPLRTWTEDLVWVRAPDFVFDPDRAVPLVSSPNVLLPDRIAMDALEQANQPYEIVFTAFDSLARRAGAMAGLGYLPLPKQLVPSGLVIEQPGILPVLPPVSIDIIAREELDIAPLTPLIDSVEHILKS
jgi:DNA-binding transcriptional LysR family regulator